MARTGTPNVTHCMSEIRVKGSGGSNDVKRRLDWGTSEKVADLSAVRVFSAYLKFFAMRTCSGPFDRKMPKEVGQDMDRGGPTDDAYPMAHTGIMNGGRCWVVG